MEHHIEAQVIELASLEIEEAHRDHARLNGNDNNRVC